MFWLKKNPIMQYQTINAVTDLHSGAFFVCFSVEKEFSLRNDSEQVSFSIPSRWKTVQQQDITFTENKTHVDAHTCMQTRIKSNWQVGRKRQKKGRIPPVALATLVNNVWKTESLGGQKGPDRPNAAFRARGKNIGQKVVACNLLFNWVLLAWCVHIVFRFEVCVAFCVGTACGYRKQEVWFETIANLGQGRFFFF